MQDRRKYKRLPIELHLEINSLFKQGYLIIDDLNATIDIINISKSGIGFITKNHLPLGYYFDAKIEFPNNEFFYAVIKIIRKEIFEERYLYGCEFVGLAEFLADKVDNYQKEIENIY